MKKKSIKIRTQGDYSPGQVNGDYVVRIEKAVFSADHSFLKEAVTGGQEQESHFDKVEAQHDVSKLGPLAEVYKLSRNSSYREKLYSAWANVSALRTPTPYETAWAVAAISPEIFNIDTGFHDQIISQLLKDNNVWVLRETIDALARTPDILKSDHIDKYIIRAAKRIYEMQQANDMSREEIKYPFVRLAAKRQKFSKLFEIIPSN